MKDLAEKLRAKLYQFGPIHADANGVVLSREFAEEIIAALTAERAPGAEPVAWLWQHTETGRTRVEVVGDGKPRDWDASRWQSVGPLYLAAPQPDLAGVRKGLERALLVCHQYEENGGVAEEIGALLAMSDEGPRSAHRRQVMADKLTGSAKWHRPSRKLPAEGATVLGCWWPSQDVPPHYGVATYAAPSLWHEPDDDEDDFRPPDFWRELPEGPNYDD